MKIEVQVSATVEVEFDETSPEFVELHQQYKKYFSNVDYKEFAEQIVSQICRYGMRDEIEGIGLVKENGEAQTNWRANPPMKVNNPINIITDLDLNDRVMFEVEAIESLR